MFSDFFAFKKKTKEEIPDVSTEELVIIEGVQPEIRHLLQEAQLLEKKSSKKRIYKAEEIFAKALCLNIKKP